MFIDSLPEMRIMAIAPPVAVLSAQMVSSLYNVIVSDTVEYLLYQCLDVVFVV